MARVASPPDPTKTTVAIVGGSFVMGDDAHYAEERPAHDVTVEAFRIASHPVTNAEFARFVRATGYVTVAERPPAPEDFPGADPEDLVPGSLVFVPTDGPVPLTNWQRWWRWTPGAHWRAPIGPGSTLNGLDRHPVVHIAYEDALAYATWAGAALPTEAEWEYAARGGEAATEYAWGEEFMPRDRPMANTWQGSFPYESTDARGFHRTSPVGSYPPNGYGLVDMIGNTWEWTATRWTESHRPTPAAQLQLADDASHESHGASCCGPTLSLPLLESDRQVIKGGSHLCAPSYCQRYRPPARQGQEVRSSTSHIGFRCVIRD